MRSMSALIAAVTTYTCCHGAAVSSEGPGIVSDAVLQFATNARLAQASSSTLNAAQITAYPKFDGVCSAFVVGYRNTGGPQLFPKWGNLSGNCKNNTAPILFGVTHENDKNNHIGSANYDPNIVAYMGDLNIATDLGRWINAMFSPAGHNSVLTMSLDTINFQQKNVTGWPLRFGHLFFGANDLSVKSPMNKAISTDFDIRVVTDLVRPDLFPNGYSGHRIMIGAKVEWDEAGPRSNKIHYLEIDLIQTDGYTKSYRDPDRPLCKDISYDRCFYSDNGQYAEGREISYRTTLKNRPIPVNSDQWVHIHIPLSEVCEKLGWVSPPASWNSAKLTGLYIGIESEGAAQARIEVSNYQTYALN